MTSGPPTASTTDRPAGTTLLRVARLMRRDRIGVASVLASATLGVAASVAGPLLIGRVVDALVAGMIGRTLPRGGRDETVERLRQQGRGEFADVVAGLRGLRPGSGVDFDRVGGLLAVLVLLFLLAAALGWLQGRLTARVVQRAANRLRGEVETKLMDLPLRYFDTVGRGEIVSRVTNDVDNVATGLQQSLSQLVTAVLTVLAVVAMMVTISPLLSLVVLVTVPLSVTITRLVGRRAKAGFIAQWKGVGKLNAHVEEVYSGHQVVAMSGQRDAMRRRFDDLNDAVYEAGLRAQFASGTLGPLTTFVSSLNFVAVAVAGGLRVTAGAITVGDVQAMLSYTRQAGQMLTQATSTANLLQSSLASAARVFELLDEPVETADAPATVVPAVAPLSGRVRSGRVEFDSVRFGYDPTKPVLHDINLVIEAGTTVAVVGPTGAGKSTLASLMLRFHDVDAGRILIDGVDIRSSPRADVRRVFAMVPQDVWVRHGTIAENIRFGAPDGVADDAAVRSAARAACLDHLVATLPGGYDTVIEPDHPVLSAGEQQLLTLARAFMADPVVLLLDEATSALDARTEALVQEATERLSAGRTSIVIAHRLRTIQSADLIVVLEHGEISERGTHAQLLGTDGAYARLHRAQWRSAGGTTALG